MKKVKQKWPCPKCGSPTRNTRTQGDITLKKCDTCGECTKVLLNKDHTEVVKILKKGRGSTDEVYTKSTLCGASKFVADLAKQEEKPKLKIKLNVKKEVSGTIIKLNQNDLPSQEEAMADIKRYFNL